MSFLFENVNIGTGEGGFCVNIVELDYVPPDPYRDISYTEETEVTLT